MPWLYAVTEQMCDIEGCEKGFRCSFEVAEFKQYIIYTIYIVTYKISVTSR